MNLTIEPNSNNLQLSLFHFSMRIRINAHPPNVKKCEFLFGNRCAREEVLRFLRKKKKKENLRRLTVSGSPTNHIYDCMRRGILVYGTSTRIDIVIFTSPRENLLIFTTKRNNKVYLLPRRNNTIIQTVFPKFGKAYRIFFGWLDAKWLEDTREGGKETERERERVSSTVKSRKISIFDMMKYHELAM